MKNKDKLERALYRTCDALDTVEDDICSAIDGHSITKAQIAKDIGTLKLRIKNLEQLLKVC